MPPKKNETSLPSSRWTTWERSGECRQLWLMTENCDNQRLGVSSMLSMCPWGAVSLLRLERGDTILLPSCYRTQSISEYLDFLMDLLKIPEEKILWWENESELLEIVQADFRQFTSPVNVVAPGGVPECILSLLVNPDMWPHVSVLGSADAQGLDALPYRAFSTIDQPSPLESLGVPCMLGAVCGSVSDLFVAYRNLSLERASIVPLADPRFAVNVASTGELGLYDFPLGPVVLRECLQIVGPDDAGADHMDDFSTDYVAVMIGSKVLCLMDGLWIDSIQAGARSCSAPEEVCDKIMEYVATVSQAFSAATPWELSIVMRNGIPTVCRASSRMSFNIITALMLARANRLEGQFFAWVWTPPPTYDIWTWWVQAEEGGFLMDLGRPQSGVFPLAYDKGTGAIFVAHGHNMSKNDARQLYEDADSKMRGSARSGSSLVKSKFDVHADDAKIYVGSARAEYKRESQRYNLPARCMGLVRPGRDVIVLSGGHTPTREFAEFMRESLNIEEWQVVYTPGETFVLDDDVCDETVSTLKRIIAARPSVSFKLVPYCVTANFLRWALQFKNLNVNVIGDDFEWVNKYGHKGILHRHVARLEEKSVLESLNVKVNIPRGYVCSTVDDLVAAHELLGSGKVVVKPTNGAAGEGILFVNDVEELKVYDFPMGDVLLEEFLNIDLAPDGIVLSPAVHYMKSELIGEDLVDQIMLGTSYMGWRKSCVNKLFIRTVLMQTEALIKALNPMGPGGFDFLSVKGIPVLSDVNTGRFNGAHYPKLFRSLYSEGSAFYCFKMAPPISLHIDVWWDRMVKAGVAYIPGETPEGVFPLIYLRGLSGMFISLASTEKRAEELFRQAKETFHGCHEHDPMMSLALFKRGTARYDPTQRKVWLFRSSGHGNNRWMMGAFSMLPLSLVRSEKDLVVLEGESVCQEYLEFIRELVPISDQVVWNSSGENDVAEAIVSAIPKDSNPSRYSLMSMEMSSESLAIAKGLLERGVKFQGDDFEKSLVTQTSAAMYRDIDNIEAPSLVSRLGCDMPVGEGYFCKNKESLLRACSAILKAKPKSRFMLIRLEDSATQKITRLSNTAECRLIDASGPVVVRSWVSPSNSQDGFPVTYLVPYLGVSILTKQPMEQLLVGGRVFGLRSGREAFPSMMKFAERYLREAKPSGGGSLEFVICDGKPELYRMHADLGLGHVVRMFMEMHSDPKLHFKAWWYTPANRLDLWSCWMRMSEANVALDLRNPKSTEGCFPLSFATGGQAVLLAIGRTLDAVEEMYKAVDATLREPAVPTAEPGPFMHATCRIYCGSDPDPIKQSVSCMRFASITRPGRDIAFLPDTPAAREYADHLTTLLGLEQWQLILVSCESMALDEVLLSSANHTNALRHHITSRPDESFIFVPNTSSSAFDQLVQLFTPLKVTILGDFPGAHGPDGRPWWFMHGSTSEDEPSVTITKKGKCTLPAGYLCSNTSELLEGYSRLTASSSALMLRPVMCGDGDHTLIITDIEQLNLYDFKFGDVYIEEMIEAGDKAADGIPYHPVVTFLGSSILGGVRDKIMVGHNMMGLRDAAAPRSALAKIMEHTKEFVARTCPQGPGSIEYSLSDTVPIVRLLSTEFSVAHVAEIFKAIHQPTAVTQVFRFHPPSHVSLKTFWGRLEEHSISYKPGAASAGVFPLVYAPGVDGLFLVIARSSLDCSQIQEKCRVCLRKHYSSPRNNVKPSEPKFRTIVLKNADAVYSPELLSQSDVIVGGTAIQGILHPEQTQAYQEVAAAIGTDAIEVIDCSGMIIVPGFVDVHVHVTGGGGELGPKSRTPEAKVNECVDGGMTTVIGVLGTDCVSRSLENLVTKCRALCDEGITAYMWTGAYRLPCPTITGSVRRDICLIEQVIGAGEIAVSDHRGTQRTPLEIAQCAAECHVGGLLSGKAGVMYCHMGGAPSAFDPLFSALEESCVPITAILPTHCDRNEKMIDQAKEWVQRGGYVDFTARSIKTQCALAEFYAEDLDLSHVILSSDSYGSLPSFDEAGQLIRYRTADTGCLLSTLNKFFYKMGWPMERILPMMTSNPAHFLKLARKGRIDVGMDADLLVLDATDLSLKYVVAKGQVLKRPGYTVQPFCQ